MVLSVVVVSLIIARVTGRRAKLPQPHVADPAFKPATAKPEKQLTTTTDPKLKGVHFGPWRLSVGSERAAVEGRSELCLVNDRAHPR